jgi:hypothetical protein
MKFDIDTSRGAKEYLIARILLQAKMEGVPLSEVEGKMLYLSETGHKLPDMEVVHDAFERYHDIQEYEERITGLIRGLLERDQASDPKALKAWDQAVRKLGREDHYVLSLIQTSGE